MRSILTSIGVLLFIAVILSGCSGNGTPAAPQQVELYVSAAVSMKDALAEIQKSYQAKNPNIKLLFNLGASGALQKQIEQGAPADIFISAAPKQMDELQGKNLINPATRKNLVENKLVVVTPKELKINIKRYEDVTQQDIKRIALGEIGTVPAGQYAKEVLDKLNIWFEVKDKVVFAKDVRTVLTYTETGNVEAGIVYKTDAFASEKVKVVAEAPEGSHQPIVYPIALVSSTKHVKEAEEFLDYLFEPESKAIFEKYGFSMSK
ncbi:molybdate ABC transporter substrate-binding protein [Dendrosporobacter sp. 1207_IL3150]|uniref:molybdate ABC transporter substrate-binding protein n=1 Tax=Dendrosporobacter sp. 1207_IL3150 TaxID=3084054 RepID=UPI002FD9D8F7